jgi:hypothetical protein
MCGSSGQLGGSDNMSNDDTSAEISEARRRALEASVAPGADIYLTYEESEALWADTRGFGVGRSSVTRDIRIGPTSLHKIMQPSETRGAGSTQRELPLFAMHSVVSSRGARQVPVGRAQ